MSESTAKNEMGKEGTSVEAVRHLVIDGARAFLIGPLDAQETIESAPGDTYLTGILWPAGAKVDAEEDDAGEEAGPDSDAGTELSIPGYRAVRPCSIGLTFSVEKGSVISVSLGKTARYELTAGQTIAADTVTDSGSPNSVSAPEGIRSTAPRRQWTRRELGYSVTLCSEKKSRIYKVREFEVAGRGHVKDDKLSLHVRYRVGREEDVLTITLINEESESGSSAPKDTRCLFQTELVVKASVGGRPSILARLPPYPAEGDEDQLVNALLYRKSKEFAVGHGIATSWGESVDQRVPEVRSEWIPSAVVSGTSASGHLLLKEFGKSYPRALAASFLGRESAKAEVVAALFAFADCYKEWIHTLLSQRLGDFEAPLSSAASGNHLRCVETQSRIRSGIELLQKDDAAWTAFALANTAMDRQSRFDSKGSAARPLVWRPFQLAFMLLVIPGLVDPTDADRECMDLLWFPTGGGKTEAYLGLTAFQIFHKRLSDSSRREKGGVDVLMRYTLRLLTVQQFQRAAALVTACEFLRQEDGRLGSPRISLGLYVGGDTTPNRMEQALEALQKERSGEKVKSSPIQLLRCPVCGSDLGAGSYRGDPIRQKIEIVCPNAVCETAGRALPVLTVDEAIYANPPSLLLGTVDKFAQLPRRQDIRRIFGLDHVNGVPPSLIIQDELHLISGPLGSMTGLYETIVDAMCTKDGVRPKIVGSTATIGYAKAQVRSLFDRDVLQFPPPGFDADDSFFAVRDIAGPDRFYLGISTAGRSPKFALQAVMASLLQTAANLLETGLADSKSIDAYWTCVAYFNSLRELGGAYVLMQDDVPRQMHFLAGRQNRTKRELPNPPVELSSRCPSADLPHLLQSLASSHSQDGVAKDTVLASNMISVGVDVPRLGLMVVNGQPKSTAEYIQATSRVGRGIPGLVITVYNFGRPRDVSHFEHFRGYHEALYRNVEATSVTPWAPRARDKALHAVFASLVRQLVPGMVGDDDAKHFSSGAPEIEGILKLIESRIAASNGEETSAAMSDLRAIIEEWERLSSGARASAGRLGYWIKKAPFGKTAPFLMCSAEEAPPDRSSGWPTPNSMREVEPSTAFVLKTIPRKSRGPDADR